ncbi:MAG: ArsR family transcriptional regulator [Planctomycetota bacterium]|nr:MAG: ArsR family transcriptional regulator [Planctomycetota bacterium]
MPATAPLDLVQRPAAAGLLLHPLRRRLLEALREPNSAVGLARRMRLPRQQLNYHLRTLEQEGLVELVEERPRRGCTERVLRASARAYVVAPQALGGLAADPAQLQDRFSADFQAALAARVLRELATLRERAAAAGKKLPTFTLDAEVRLASAAALRAFTEELAGAVATVVARHHDERTPAGRRFRLFLGSHPVLKKPSEAKP